MENQTTEFIRKNVAIEHNYLEGDDRKKIPVCPYFNTVRYFACDVAGLYSGLEEIVAEKCYCGHNLLVVGKTRHFIASMVCKQGFDKIVEMVNYLESKDATSISMPGDEFYINLIKAESPSKKARFLQEGLDRVNEYLRYTSTFRRLNNGIRKTNISVAETITEGKRKIDKLGELIDNCGNKPIYCYETFK